MAAFPRAILKQYSLPRRSFLDVSRVASMSIAVKAAGAIKTAISARVFGLSNALDAYLIAFSILSFVCDCLAGALAPALVPVFVKRAMKDGKQALYARYGATLYAAVFLLSGVGVLVTVFRGTILVLFASAFPPEKVVLTRGLILVLAPIFPLTGVSAVWRSLLNSESRFAIAAISPVTTPVIAILFLSIADKLGIYALALGSTVGATAEILILAFYLNKIGIPILPAWRGTLVDTHWLRKEYLPFMVSNLIHGGVNVVDQAVAALLGPGSVSILILGTRLVAVIMAIGPATLSTVFLPKLSRMAAWKDWAVLRLTVAKSLLVSMSAMCLIATALIACSLPLTHLAFRGSSPTGTEIHTLTIVQSFSFLQLPFAVGSVILIRVIISLQMNRKLLSISFFALVANVLVDFSLIPFLDVAGIALSTAIVQALTFLALVRCVGITLRNRAPAYAAA